MPRVPFTAGAPYKQAEANVLTLLSELPVRPTARFQHSALSVGTTMVVFGGRDKSGERVNDLWKHVITGTHPDNHTWTELIPVTTSASSTVPAVCICAVACSVGGLGEGVLLTRVRTCPGPRVGRVRTAWRPPVLGRRPGCFGHIHGGCIRPVARAH